jgi:hypothetical protein
MWMRPLCTATGAVGAAGTAAAAAASPACLCRNSRSKSSSRCRIVRLAGSNVEWSASRYEQSAPNRTHAAHAGRALSHLVRRNRHVRHAWVARLRGYVAAARGRRRFVEVVVAVLAGAGGRSSGDTVGLGDEDMCCGARMTAAMDEAG